MDAREQRGIIIAALTRIDRKDGVWLVPSQSETDRKYAVNLEAKTCSCPDHTETGFKCKHLFAVEITLKRELGMNGTFSETRTLTVTEKVTCERDWSVYDTVQTNEKDQFQILLHDLCAGIEQPARKLGRPGRDSTLHSDAVFAAAFKIYSTVSSRRFLSDLREAHRKGYVTKPIHYASISTYLDNEETTPILNDLIIKSSLPLKAIESDFAVDSSGFSTARHVRWYDQKYGIERTGNDWVKAHIMCGVKTNVVTSIEIHDRDAADAPLFLPLVKTTADNFKIREISADKAYLSEANLAMTDAVGATPYIPFKVNSTARKSGSLWERMFHVFSLNRAEFDRHYHKRSNVESTFSMIKAKFGSHVRSRSATSMKNEVYCKVLCHNLCCLISASYTLGLTPQFS